MKYYLKRYSSDFVVLGQGLLDFLELIKKESKKSEEDLKEEKVKINFLLFVSEKQ